MSTAEIGLSVRTTNCLEERGIYTVNDLLNSTADDLLSISNFGEKTLDEVYKALEAIGFYRRSRRRAKSGATKSSRRLGNRGDWPWRAFSDSTRRNAATGGPVPGCWAASARPSSSPSSSSGVAPGWWWPSSPWWCPSGGSTTTSSRTTCTVRDKRIGEDRGNSGLCRPEVQIHYTVAGTPYDPWVYDIHRAYSGSRPEAEAAIAAYVEGQRYVCWYDPARPEVAVLVRGYHGWNWLVLIVPLSFVAIGGGGLVYTWLHWGKSAESRAARLRRAPARPAGRRRRHRRGPARSARAQRHHQQSRHAAEPSGCR